MDSSENGSTPSKQRLTMGFLISIMALCAKHANRVSKKLKLKASKPKENGLSSDTDSPRFYAPKSPLTSPNPKPRENGLFSDSPRFYWPKSPLRSPRPKQFLANVSNKAITLVNRRKIEEEKGKDAGEAAEFGDGGVWQRTILMGDKCQPLDFSGVIYYDSKGKQMEELPIRSPRASPLPGYLARRELWLGHRLRLFEKSSSLSV